MKSHAKEHCYYVEEAELTCVASIFDFMSL